MEKKALLNTIQPSAGPVFDSAVREKLNSFSLGELNRYVGSAKLPARFLEQYHEWIVSGTENHIFGLDSTFRKDATLAVTQCLEAFYMWHRNKRFRLAKGEYVANTALLSAFGLNWEWLENDEIRAGDAIIISAPFCSSGDVHPDFYDYMGMASRIGVPVLVDCAFWGLCYGIELNLDYPCIESVTFSLSKCFWLNGYRIGMQFSRNPAPSIRLLNDRGYINRFGAVVACALMKEFGPDYIAKKYRAAQRQICDHLNLEPSKTIIFGLGDSSWSQFNRGGIWNRVCFNQSLANVTGGGEE